MKKLFIPFLVLMFTSIFVNAQVFNWNTNDSASTLTADGFVILDLSVTNITGDSLLLDWNTVKNSFPIEWDVTICDYNTCYIGIPDTGSMAKIADGEQGFISLTVGTSGAAGKGELRFYIYDENNPAVGDTATFIIEALATGIEETNKNDFRIFPSPANNYLTIASSKSQYVTVSVVDMQGREVKSFGNINSKQTISIDQLPGGIYFLKIIDHNNQLYYNRFVKN